MKKLVFVFLALGAAYVVWAGAPAQLPVRRVTMFTSGVGYFERSGEVQDDQSAELWFKTEQMVDLIKSLVVVDEGKGTISAVTYDARDPLDRTLKSFAVDLTDNPATATLLNRLRGVEVRVKTASGDHAGRIVGVEAETVKEDDAVLTRHWLKLFTEGQIRTLRLDLVQSFELADAKLNDDLAAALATLAGNLDRDKKGVRLDFRGKGRRTVRVGYMLESPVWKTSYRLVLDDKGALLQGWAHVENTTDEDWRDVQLTLVSGRPFSFIQNLYDPIYLKRPEVRMDLYAVAAPPAYEAPMEQPEVAGLFMAPAPAAMREMPAKRVAGARRDKAGFALDSLEAENIAASVSAAAEGQEAGELFVYDIKDPVTLPRRQSAMLPIVNTRIGAEKLSIFNRRTNERYAYNGAEITNTTGQFLMQGPITVFDEGIYAGDARLSDTPRGEAKLLSYALDLTSEVRVEDKNAWDEITTLKIVQGVLQLTKRYEARAEYTIKNKRDRERRYLIEQPIRSDWELVEPSKGVEKTRDFYRYRFSVGAGKTEKVAFVEQRFVSDTIALLDLDSDRISFYQKERRIPAGVRKAFEKLAQMQFELADVRGQRQDRERRIKEITDEQNRIRENMKTVMKPSDSYSMWESKLVKQEKDLDALRMEIEKLREQEMKKEKALRDYVANLNAE